MPALFVGRDRTFSSLIHAQLGLCFSLQMISAQICIVWIPIHSNREHLLSRSLPLELSSETSYMRMGKTPHYYLFFVVTPMILKGPSWMRLPQTWIQVQALAS